MRLASRIGRNISDATRRVSRSAAKGAKERIDAGVTPPLKESTIALRRERGTGGTKPLYETGDLYRSIKSTKEGLEMNKYGIYHHYGFTAHNVPIGKDKDNKPKFIHNKWITKSVPARPFIFPSKKEILDPLKKTTMDIRRSLKRNKVIT